MALSPEVAAIIQEAVRIGGDQLKESYHLYRGYQKGIHMPISTSVLKLRWENHIKSATMRMLNASWN